MNTKEMTESWEMMNFCKEILGVTELQKIFSRGHTQVNRYCMNPKFEDSQRNPLDRIRLLIEKLTKQGQALAARTMLNHLAEPLGCRMQPVEEVVPDKETIEEECLDDYPELVELNRLVSMRANPATVRTQAETAIREIQETCALYDKLWDKGDAS